MTYQFEFEKKRLIAFAMVACLLCLVIFFAGIVAEMLMVQWANVNTVERNLGGLAKQSGLSASAEKSDGAAITSSGPSTTTVGSRPATTERKDETNPAGGATTTSTSVTATLPVADGKNLQLAVQVNSFTEEASAKRLASQLESAGFSPTIVPSVNVGNKQVNVVEIGPFSDWEKASQIAQEIRLWQGMRPVVRPMLR